MTVADSADTAPTTQAAIAYQELSASAAGLHKQWDDIRNRQIPSINSELQKAGLTPIDPAKPFAEELGGASDGDDEP